MDTTITSINQLLSSYTNFRAAVLRQMGFDEMIQAEFQRVSGRPGMSQQARRRNPAIWEPADIHAFARKLNLWNGKVHRLDGLISLLDELPYEQQTKVRRVCGLTLGQLDERRHSPARWRAGELARLTLFMSRFR